MHLSCLSTTGILTAILPVKLASYHHPPFYFPTSPIENLGVSGTGFLQTRCPSFLPFNHSDEALKKTQSIDPLKLMAWLHTPSDSSYAGSLALSVSSGNALLT